MSVTKGDADHAGLDHTWKVHRVHDVLNGFMRKLRAIAASSPKRAVVLTAVWFSVFLYAGRPLQEAFVAAGLPAAAGWALLLLLSLLPAVPVLTRRGHISGNLVVALFSTMLVLVVVSDVLRGAYYLARWAISAQTWPLLDPRAVSLTILGAASALSFVGLLQARYPRVYRVDVAIEDLPPELEGYRIVQLSDVHIGPTIRRRFVQGMVEKANALDADAVAITGDLVDGHLDELADEVEPLRELRARDGVFYVTGNHEYYWRPNEWIPALENLGLVFLKNAHRVVERGSARLVFAGIPDIIGRNSHKPDPPRALSGAPDDAVKVLLSHRPHMVKDAEALGVHLQLSGHTHGGQFFPWNFVSHRVHPVATGLRRIGRTWLYVNRGTGYWGPPSRLGVGGEITVIQLVRGV
jgi:predicted MPP superfamily phosphohydrolase